MQTQLSSADRWSRTDDTYVSGSAFLDGELLSSESLSERISTIDGVDELREVLRRANGFFSVVHDAGDTVFVAVDHVRSWPVYYAATDDIYVSDSAEWVDSAAARRGYDPIAATEYLFAGYVSGPDTLNRDVKQVQAGELVTISRTRTGPRVNRERYVTYDPVENSSPIDVDELDEVLADAVGRLIEYADGRTILLGLSGGYDSRLIALLLSRLGYDDTVTYTTGSASGSADDIPVASSIATDLDFEHITVRSDRSAFEPIDESPAVRALVDRVGYLSEYPHINKTVLARNLEAAGITPDDVVHVLGHHLLGGSSFLPAELRDQDFLDRQEFMSIMMNRHYSNWEAPAASRWRGLFEGRILDRIPADLYRTGDVESTSDGVNGSELWYWQERLPKYILARREYEHLGFDVWYPLLDRALYSLFEASDQRERIGKRVLKAYVRELDEDVRGGTSDLHAITDGSAPSIRRSAWDGTVRLIHALPDPATERVRRAYKAYRRRDDYIRDPRYGIVSREEFDSMSLRTVHYRPLLLLYLYDRGYFGLPGTTELDRALPEKSASN